MEILVYKVRIEIHVGAAKRSRDVNVSAPIHGNGLAIILVGSAHGLRIPVSAVGIYLG